MNYLFQISLRNLLRQKRRNFLLGIAIAFGTLVLIMASAFSHGISEVLFNEIVVYVSGHVSLNFADNGNQFAQVFHDGPRVLDVVKKEVPEMRKVQESMGVMARAIGNGKSDNVIMVGIDLNSGDEKDAKDAEKNFKMITGNFMDLGDSTIENPVVLSEVKAKYLNVKKGDIIRVRYKMVNGQDQASRITVVGIFKPANMFMSAPIFLEINDLKRISGYGPNDIGTLFISLNNPKKDAINIANRLQKKLQPSLAGIYADMSIKGIIAQSTILGTKSDTASRNLLARTLTFTDSITQVTRDAVFISDSLANVLHAKTGDLIQVDFKSKYSNEKGFGFVKVTGIYTANKTVPQNVVLVNELDFYKLFYSAWPQNFTDNKASFVPDTTNALYKTFSPEWNLLSRVKTTEEMTKQMREVGSKRIKGTSVSVQSMYESASAVLKLEVALHMITFVAVMILFFIILIGVINTLRMTIRERTREIGTIRAIGMQKSDVKMTFVLETFFLSLFSAVSGTVLAFGAMKIISMIKIDSGDNPMGMLLSNGHLHFAPTVLSVICYILLIIAIAVSTAYFPARRASNLSSAEALRHYE
jgi:ABC-type lipoprotein release transport system permease subunit